MKQAKRILAWILALILLMSTLPCLTATAQAVETEEAEATEPTQVETVPATTEEAVPETTEATVPETTEAAVPEATEATVPETTEAAVPEATEATMPETTEVTIPEATEETIPENTGETLTEEAMLTIGTDGLGRTTFETFEDLKYLVATLPDTAIVYVGREPLIITESIEIPNNLGINVRDGQLIVPKRITFTVNGWLTADTIQIDGTMYLAGRLSIYTALNVSGALNQSGRITMASDAVLSGGANIHFTSSDAQIKKDFYINNSTQLNDAFSTVKQAPGVSVNYSLYIQADVTLQESAEISENIYLRIEEGATLRVPAGCTLELNTWIQRLGDLVIEGTLVNNADASNESGPTSSNCIIAGTMINNAHFYISNGNLIVNGILENNADIQINYKNGGSLQITNGTYRGSGTVKIDAYGQGPSFPEQAVSGLNLSNFYVSMPWEGEWELISKEGKTQLGAPTDLRWGYFYDKLTGTLVERPGCICWKPTEPFQGWANVTLYKKGQEEPVNQRGTRHSSMTTEEYYVDDLFFQSDCESGTYYFAVTAMGDGTEYCNSETVVSDTWTYTKPKDKLDACDHLSWDWPKAKWSLPENAGGYELVFYFAPSEEKEPESIGGISGTFYSSTVAPVYDEVIQRNGDGYYYFKVRAISSDITKYQNGPWSELSPAYYLTSKTINEQLDAITSANPATIKQAVQDLNTEDLKSAMLADQSGTGTVAKLQELEKKAGTTTKVNVTNQASAFDQSKVSIVGAGLNDVVNSAKDITLIVDKPAKNHVIPAQYNNSVAVKFSMGLDNVQNTKALEVPVKITLPIPNKINPNFLAILHYCADGSVEEITLPYIYREENQYYASFVLTGFSDFAMVEKRAGIPGDLNGDGQVNTDDALYLALNLFYPEDFPLNGDGDLNSDGNVNTDDALYLALYLFYPEDFPLYP